MAIHDDKVAQRRSKEAQKKHEFTEHQIDKAVGALAESREGRMFLWWLLQRGKVGTQPFAGDPHVTSFQCGELNVGNQILARIISVDPLIYTRMQQENLEHDRRTNQPDLADEPYFPLTGGDDTD